MVDKLRTCPNCGGALIFKQDVFCPDCKKHYRCSPQCPRCNQVIRPLGDVWWCNNCAGWIAPNDVFLVIGDEYKSLFTFTTKEIASTLKGKPQEPPLPPPSEQGLNEPPPPPSEQYKCQFHCKSCGHSFWVYERRFKIPYCQECGAPNPKFIKFVKI